ncbi:hypothetical protein Cs7R123_49410 [Catellatospora sp. TT07R-123]|uniref:trypsin-like peptidase domain-containing protein n=1 Tax=Catellatospora sp. TT07R-123 TaxID=2733863 RepID=UPI001B21111B|nr:trypsin-like peptidase domain-containing protein [Catellatospora sp. TT07R-123]GHJ47599.1 hypothetical protein Cs7R123_49410 [Catellatospora sp. TT07R-123]
MTLENHIARAVLVDGVKSGSGYAIGPDLVLTAGHIVGALGKLCIVQPFGKPKYKAVVVWRGDGLDVDAALVQLRVAAWTPAETVTRYGRLVGSRPIGCVTVGYSWARKKTNSPRPGRIEEGHWLVMPSTGIEDQRYALSSDIAVPKERILDQNAKDMLYKSPWAGHSGSALITDKDRVLIGIVRSAPEHYTTDRLEAVRIDYLMTDAVFATLVGSHLSKIEPLSEADSFNGIVEHMDEVRGLTGMAANLRIESLPYLAPDPISNTHPDRILDELDRCASESGTLLVGAAGIGKTRTCFEVGERAVSAGWQVLHVKAGKTPVTTEQLLSTILRGPSRVLVIVDYLNESRLDLAALRHQVFPEARRRGIRLALLASARPGWFHRQDDPELRHLFRTVDLQLEGQYSDAIQRHIVRSLAPSAIRVVGEGRLLNLCGKRPVLAVLIALEAEAKAKAGLLHPTAKGIRPGQLIDWLTSRLEEDKLLPAKAASLLEDKDPPLALQVCAAMVAAMPQTRESIVECGSAAFGESEGSADHLLAVLYAMGWVTSSDEEWSVVHDIVADQLLERTLVRRISNTVRANVAERVLASCLTQARTLGRFARNLGRLLRDLELDEREADLSNYCATWLPKHVLHISKLLSSLRDEGGYTIIALIENTAWSSVVHANWATIVRPWLTEHAGTRQARYIIYRGLKFSSSEESGLLLVAALTWLSEHGALVDAQLVLAPLLKSNGIPESTTADIQAHASAWLRLCGSSPEAQFVLSSLLDRTDLVDPKSVHAAAFKWLELHGTSPEAQFVLSRLLDRTDLVDPKSVHAAAFKWLQLHGTSPEAQFVLSRLLDRTDLVDPKSVHAAAFKWLQLHGTSPEARFVLNSLLGRPRQSLGLTDAYACALSWLDTHGAMPEARFLLASLLKCADLIDLKPAVTHAYTWLAHNGGASEAGFLLGVLLRRNGAEPEIAAHAFTWLADHGAKSEARFVIAPLLKPGDLPALTDAAIFRFADNWLTLHGHLSEARIILVSLLKRGDIPSSAIAYGHVFNWLAQCGTTMEAQLVLSSLLKREELPEPDFVCECAISWLASRGGTPEARFVLTALLGREDLPDANATYSYVHKWIAAHNSTPDAAYVHSSLWRRNGLPDPDAAWPATRDWLSQHGGIPEAQLVLSSLLKREELPEPDFVCECAISWLASRGGTPEARFVLTALLGREDLPDANATYSYVHKWIAAHNSTPDAAYVHSSLWRGNGLPDPDAAWPATRDWLSQHGGTLKAAYVLNSILQRGNLPDVDFSHRYAFAWLSEHGGTPEARFVLAPLLDQVDSTGVTNSHIRAHSWPTAHEASNVGHSTTASPQHDRLHESIASAVHAYCRLWIATHGSLKGAWLVIAALLRRRDSRAPAIADALDWLTEHGHVLEARFVIAELLSSDDLPELLTVTVHGFAFAWLTNHGDTRDAGLLVDSLLNNGVPPEHVADKRTAGKAVPLPGDEP